jgi:hypothetical protein
MRIWSKKTSSLLALIIQVAKGLGTTREHSDVMKLNNRPFIYNHSKPLKFTHNYKFTPLLRFTQSNGEHNAR